MLSMTEVRTVAWSSWIYTLSHEKYFSTLLGLVFSLLCPLVSCSFGTYFLSLNSSQLSSSHIIELGLNFSYIVLHAPDYVEIMNYSGRHLGGSLTLDQ